MTEPVTPPVTPDPAAEPLAAEPAAPTAPPAPSPDVAAPTAPPATTTATAASAEATAASLEAPVAAAESTPRRRLALMAGLARIARLAVMVAIFAAGVTLGYARFQAMQPGAAAAAATNPVTAGETTPISVHALIQALRQNDLDAARTSVSPLRNEQGEVITDPYRWLAGELQTMRLQAVSKVQLVGTFVDGQRTATAIVITGRNTQGADVSRQLIVQTVDGNIVSFK